MLTANTERCNHRRVAKVISKRGPKPKYLAPEVGELLRTIALHDHLQDACRHYGISRKTLYRWMIERGVPLPPARKQRPRGVTPRFVGIARKSGGGRVSCRLYNSFDAMHKRCYSPSRWEYDVYGGRGIRVCDEWRRNYPAFREWALAHGFRKGLTLDRIDGTGNYEPSNCRWATRQEQTYNTKSVYRLTLNGVTKLLPIWARELGLSMETLRVRKRSGWPDEHVLTVPKGGRCPGFPYQRPGRKPLSNDGAQK